MEKRQSRLFRWFENLNIIPKMISVYFLGMFVLLIFLSLFLIITANRYAVDALTEESWTDIEYCETLIQKEQEDLIGIAEYFCISSDVQNMLHDSNSGLDVEPGSGYMAALQMRSYILSTVLYNLDGEPVMYMSIDGSAYPVRQTPENAIFTSLISDNRNYGWSFIDKNSSSFMERDHSPKLCLWYSVKDNRTRQPIGVIAVSIDTRKLLSVGFRYQLLYDTMIILSSDGQSVFCSPKNEIQLSEEARAALSSYVTANSGNHHGASIMTLDGTRYRVCYGHVADTPLFIFSINRYQPLVWNRITVFVYAIFAVIVCGILSIPMIALCSTWITKPVRKLSASMEEFMNGDESVRVSITGKDEIGRMGRVFNKMVVQQQELLETNYKVKIREQQARLEMQQEQINPHFLYNMLHSIQWMALKKNDREIANAAYALGNFFRLSLSNGQHIITIGQEFDLVRHYLYLQSIRFPDLINYTIDIDNNEKLSQALVPKLIIQPLVENSIIHGMKSSETPLTIRMSCRSNEDFTRLVLTVEDDGLGIPEDVLPQLPDRLEMEGSRFALKNVSTRLNLLYAGDYSFDFSNRPEGGACVRIETPIKFE